MNLLLKWGVRKLRSLMFKMRGWVRQNPFQLVMLHYVGWNT